MKKLTIAALALMMLTACGGNTPTTKTGKAEKEIDNQGSAEIVTVEVTLEGDKVTAVNINETYHGQTDTKKELKEEYGMAFMAQKNGVITENNGEWYEQVAYLENYIIENGIDAVELNESGYPVEGSDLTAGCTINLTNIKATVQEAIANAE